MKINVCSIWPFAQISDDFYYLDIWQRDRYFAAALEKREVSSLGLELPGLGLDVYDKVSVSSRNLSQISVSEVTVSTTSLLNDHGTEKGQCVVCYCVLSNEPLRPSKLSNHLEKKHPGLKNKSEEYFKRLESSCKRQRLDATGSFQQSDKKLTEASFVVSQIIAKQKKLIILGRLLLNHVH